MTKYLTIEEARATLAELNLKFSPRQMRRIAVERKLPFFPDPANGRLKIAEDELHSRYRSAQNAASKEFDNDNEPDKPRRR